MSLPTYFLGYGPFRLEDLLSFELFVFADGRAGQVASKQQQPKHADRIAVVINPCSVTQAKKVLLHPSAHVFVYDPDHARTISRRVDARRRRARQKGR
jgi:hypothetical protein